jgi:hypothetical protein
MNTVSSRSYSGDTARPSSPPSPRGTACRTVCTVRLRIRPVPVPGLSATIRRVSRSVVSAVPSGRNATAQGTRKPSASTVATTLGGPVSSGAAVAVGVGRRGGPPPSLSVGGPKEQATTSGRQAITATARRTRGVGAAT